MNNNFIKIQTNKIDNVLALLTNIDIKYNKTQSIYIICKDELTNIKKYLLELNKELDKLKDKTLEEILNFILKELNIINIIIKRLTIFNSCCLKINSIIFYYLNDYIKTSELFLKIAKLLTTDFYKSIDAKKEAAAIIIQKYFKTKQEKYKKDQAANVIKSFIKDSLQKHKEKNAMEIIIRFLKKNATDPDMIAQRLVYPILDQVIYQLEGEKKASKLLSTMKPLTSISDQMHKTPKIPSKQMSTETGLSKFLKISSKYPVSTRLQTSKQT